MKRLVLAVLLVASGCVTSRAEGDAIRQDMTSLKKDMAELQRQQSDERAQQKARLEQMQQRVDALDATLAGLRQADADSGVQLEKVVAEVQALRGDIEQAKHELGETSASVKSILEHPPVSVAAETKAPLADPNKPTQIGGESVPADAKGHYDFAKKLFDAKKYTEAADAFDLFLQRHADAGDQVANAAYWKAEALFALAGSLQDQKAKEKALKQAIIAYQRVLEDPKSSKSDIALFKVGTAFEQLGFKDEAAVCYQELLDKHPKSSLVKDAKARLKAIGPLKKKK